jgi:type IV secretory pathway protease TraF
MREARGFRRAEWGDGFRRTLEARAKRRRRLLILPILFLVGGLATFSVSRPMPLLLVWNSSPSAPVGLYRLVRRPPRKGDMVIAWAPLPARSMASARHYLPSNVPLVKRVAAGKGDLICASGASVRIGGRVVATRLRRDRLGRMLPWPVGCKRLGSNDYFLLNQNPRSFDGRYFGISHSGEIIAVAELLWAR